MTLQQAIVIVMQYPDVLQARTTWTRVDDAVHVIYSETGVLPTKDGYPFESGFNAVRFPWCQNATYAGPGAQ